MFDHPVNDTLHVEGNDDFSMVLSNYFKAFRNGTSNIPMCQQLGPGRGQLLTVLGDEIHHILMKIHLLGNIMGLFEVSRVVFVGPGSGDEGSVGGIKAMG